MGEYIYDYPQIAYAVVGIITVVLFYMFKSNKMRVVALIIGIILAAYVHYEANRSPLDRMGAGLSSGLKDAGAEAKKLFQ